MRLGFSLVELSIVLVILGLLTGGILAGQSLIRASELRAVSTEYQRYVTAVHAFKDKYFQAAGDFTGATRFWSRQTTDAWCVSTHGLAAAGSPGTCDGNGSNAVGGGFAASQSGEAFQFWRQLALAGLIEGSYDGLAGSGGTLHTVLGTNAPASKLTNAGWAFWTLGDYAGNATLYALDYGTMFEFGASITNGSPYGAALKPEEAWNIDTKIDDGRPARGKIIARYWNNACAVADDGGSANNDYAASYNLDENSIQCSLYFVRQL